MESPSIGRSSGNGRCFPKSGFRKARLKSMLTSKALRDGALTKQLKRVRAIFIGHGEVGKTSLITCPHGEEVIEPQER